MYELDKEKFGTFLSRLRRERGMPQEELSEERYTPHKAVSKWERGDFLRSINIKADLLLYIRNDSTPISGLRAGETASWQSAQRMAGEVIENQKNIQSRGKIP